MFQVILLQLQPDRDYDLLHLQHLPPHLKSGSAFFHKRAILASAKSGFLLKDAKKRLTNEREKDYNRNRKDK